jgi:hypothetical protein
VTHGQPRVGSLRWGAPLLAALPACHGCLAGVSLGETQRGALPSPWPVGVCAEYGDAVAHGSLPDAVVEASGLSSSAWDAGRLWVHNDSGSGPVLYAIDRAGRLLSEVRLEGIDSNDWEDVARGPCAPGDAARRCLYVGDIGDNPRERPWVAVHRLAEPQALAPHLSARVETARFTYPRGARNAEAMVIDASGAVLIFTKQKGRSELYTAAFVPGATTTLTLLGELEIRSFATGGRTLVTAADLDTVSGRLLLRTYDDVREYRLAPGQPVAAMLTMPPRALPVGVEMQGEAITWLGGGYVTVSEGSRQALHFVPCRVVEPAAPREGSAQSKPR